MSFDSLFGDAMIIADQAIAGVFGTEFKLSLRDGSSLDINAIFDTSQEQTGDNKYRSLIAENGALTVLNQRIERTQIYSASVVTPLGTKYVASVEYPDATTSLLILTTKQQSNTVAPNDNFL